MLERISLSNFQGYKGLKSIDLAPLTLIFGPNSGGKSSVIRSLLLLKQSFASRDQNASDLSYVGQSVNLVGFPNVIFGHKTKEKLVVGCELGNLGPIPQLHSVGIRYETDDNGLKVIWLDYVIGIIGSAPSLIPDEHRYGQVTIQLEPQARSEESESITEYDLGGGFWRAISIEKSGLLDALLLNIGDSLAEIRRGKDKSKNEDHAGPLPTTQFVERGEKYWLDVFSNLSLRYLLPNERLAGFYSQRKRQGDDPDALRARRVLSMLLNYGNGSINIHFEGISHLDPLREIPARIEVLTGQTNSEDSSVERETLKKVSSWIEQLTEGRFSLDSSSSELSNASFLGNVRTRLLIDNHTGTKVSFQDVGVGLSQVEPILAALEQAVSRGKKRKRVASRIGASMSTLLIQQPELHLHPKMQSDLMNVFIEAVNSPDSKLQIIAETHSENMILRLQKKIREREIDIDQVCVLYAEKDPNGEGNRIQRLELDSDGRFLTSWPMSFLDIRMDDLL
jgi:predicted ATPase